MRVMMPGEQHLIRTRADLLAILACPPSAAVRTVTGGWLVITGAVVCIAAPGAPVTVDQFVRSAVGVLFSITAVSPGAAVRPAPSLAPAAVIEWVVITAASSGAVVRTAVPRVAAIVGWFVRLAVIAIPSSTAVRAPTPRVLVTVDQFVWSAVGVLVSITAVWPGAAVWPAASGAPTAVIEWVVITAAPSGAAVRSAMPPAPAAVAVERSVNPAVPSSLAVRAPFPLAAFDGLVLSGMPAAPGDPGDGLGVAVMHSSSLSSPPRRPTTPRLARKPLSLRPTLEATVSFLPSFRRIFEVFSLRWG